MKYILFLIDEADDCVGVKMCSDLPQDKIKSYVVKVANEIIKDNIKGEKEFNKLLGKKRKEK